jgi:hypothetical protein
MPGPEFQDFTFSALLLVGGRKTGNLKTWQYWEASIFHFFCDTSRFRPISRIETALFLSTSMKNNTVRFIQKHETITI